MDDADACMAYYIPLPESANLPPGTKMPERSKLPEGTVDALLSLVVQFSISVWAHKLVNAGL